MPTRTSLRLLAAAVLALGFSRSAALAAKPSNLVPAQVTFADANGDLIRSDGQGTYTDGQSGVSCGFHDPALGGSGDLTFHTSSGNATVQRTMAFFFPSTQFDPGCPFDVGGSLPASSQSASLTVRGIYGMAYPSTMATEAIFFLTEGQLWYGLPGYCSRTVQVTRLDASRWTITATPTPAPEAQAAGDIAVLRLPLKGRTVLTEYWEMPFTLTASTLP